MKTIILHGGEADGKEVVIDDALYDSRLVRVPIPDQFPEFLGSGDLVFLTCYLVAVYELRTCYSGKPGTCEFRTWTEWHHHSTTRPL